MSDTHTTVQYQLRLPDYLREKIRESAEKHNRSMNSDMVARLEQSFQSPNDVEQKLENANEFYSNVDKKLSEVMKQLVKLTSNK